MKIKNIAIMLMAGSLVFSCQKEEITTNESNDEKQHQPVMTERAGSGRMLYKFTNQSSGEERYTCNDSGGSCGPTTTVTASTNLPVILTSLYAAIDNHDNTQITNLFTANQSVLETVLPTNIVNGVINNHIEVDKKEDANGEPIIYLAFADLMGEIVWVQPFSNHLDTEEVSSLKDRTNSNDRASHRAVWIVTNESGEVVGVFCFGSGGMCCHDINVVASRANPIINIIDSENNSLIKSAFEDNQTLLNDYFGTENVVKVINGEYIVHNLGTFNQDGVDKVYIEFIDSNNNRVSVHPLQLK